MNNCKMSKEKLLIDDFYDDFLLYGIISDVKEYKLAWQLNKFLEINLVMQEEVVIEFKNNKKLYVIYYLSDHDYYKIKLIKNLAVESKAIKSPYLIPELKNYQYFLMVEGEETWFFEEQEPMEKLRKTPFIQYTSSIDIDQLKSIDNLIF